MSFHSLATRSIVDAIKADVGQPEDIIVMEARNEISKPASQLM